MEQETIYMKEDIQLFQEVEGLRVTKPFKTPNGDVVKLVHLNKNRLIATGDGDFTLNIDGDTDQLVVAFDVKGIAGELWDSLKKLAGALKGAGAGVLDAIGGGSGCEQSIGSGNVTVVIIGNTAPVITPTSVTNNCTKQ
jgi:hypothetical protein